MFCSNIVIDKMINHCIFKVCIFYCKFLMHMEAENLSMKSLHTVISKHRKNTSKFLIQTSLDKVQFFGQLIYIELP